MPEACYDTELNYCRWKLVAVPMSLPLSHARCEFQKEMWAEALGTERLAIHYRCGYPASCRIPKEQEEAFHRTAAH